MTTSAFMSIFIHFGIESTNVEHILTTSSSWYQVLTIAEISFCTVEQSVFSILCSIIAHKFLIGLRSGKFPGQSRMVISFSSKNVRIFLKYGMELDNAGKYNHYQQSLFPAQVANMTAMLPCICHCLSYLQ